MHHFAGSIQTATSINIDHPRISTRIKNGSIQAATSIDIDQHRSASIIPGSIQAASSISIDPLPSIPSQPHTVRLHLFQPPP